ncbi:MAG TPA: hypothetical protein VHT04_16560 [Stellaceae bacterium]|jgi:hypothetical protein|nr:hypothetical protein [Stellaceae bacterium]
MLIHSAYSSRAVFRIYRSRSGRWCAATGDGMIGGTFFDRAAAIRFARRESYGAPLRLVEDERLSRVGASEGRSAAAA